MPVADLPEVSYLELHGELSDCRSLLDHITFPPHVQLHTSAPRSSLYARTSFHHDALLGELRQVLGVAHSNMERAEEQLSSVEIHMDRDLTLRILCKTKLGRDQMHCLFDPDVTIEDIDWFVVRTTTRIPHIGNSVMPPWRYC